MNATLKYPLIIAMALALSFSLIFLMQLLISIDSGALGEPRDRQITDIHMPDHKLELIRRAEKPERPKTLAVPPPLKLQPESPDIPEQVKLDVPPVAVDTSIDLDDFAMGVIDGDYLPIIRVAPVYPLNALRSGIEGYAIVEFTVTRTGSVTDVRVVDAQPRHVFSRVAREAATQFKYKPMIVDGEPVDVKGVKNKFTFRISR